MFFRDDERDRLINRAKEHIRATGIIPLDLFADLHSAGVDVTELERNTHNENS